MFFIHFNYMCPECYNKDLPFISDDTYEKCCTEGVAEGAMCKADGVDGVDDNEWGGCEQYRLNVGFDEIALPCEMGLYFDFKMTDGVPHGCRGLEHFNASMRDTSSKLF